MHFYGILLQHQNIHVNGESTLAQLVKASVGQADVQRFEPHLGHNLVELWCVSCKVQALWAPSGTNLRQNWQSLLAGGSVAIQTWSIYKVYT